MDLRAQRIQDARYVDNESNDSGLSSETSQNSKERPSNIFDTRNLSSIRAVHFALDNHRKMASQRSQSTIVNDRKPIKYLTSSSSKDPKDLINLKSKNNSQMSPFMVKINPKSSPCCEYLMDDIKQLQLPISDNIEIGCDFEQYSQELTSKPMPAGMDSCNQFEDKDVVHSSTCYEDQCSYNSNYKSSFPKDSYCSQIDFSSFSISTSNQTDESSTENNFIPIYQSENCLHSILQSLDKSKDLLSSFRLLMSTRDSSFRLKTSNQVENSFSGLIVFDILKAENLQPPVAPLSSSSLKLLQCIVKINSDCRIETSSEILADKVIWDERFFVDLRESDFISILIYQSNEGCNKRLSYYGGLSLIELINDLQNQSQFWDQIILQLEPRGLLYIQLGLIPLRQSLSRLFCYHFSKNPQNTSTHSPRFSNFVQTVSDWIYILRWCIAAVEEKQRITTINIYKITVCESKVIHLLKQIMKSREHGNQLQLEINVHAITSLIILCLREICEPLIPAEFTQRFLMTFERFFNIYDPNGQHLAAEILSILRTLPNQNQMAVFELLQHLYSVIQNGTMNKITCHYLALLFAPLIFHVQDSIKYQDLSINDQVQLMKSLLENWPFIQDSKPVKVPTYCKADKYLPKPMVSVAIQTDESLKYHLTNLSSDNDKLENSKTCKTLVYKSILKKPQLITKNTDSSSNNDYNRTTFI